MKKVFTYPIGALILIFVFALAAYLVVIFTKGDPLGVTPGTQPAQQASVFNRTIPIANDYFFVDYNNGNGTCWRGIYQDDGTPVALYHGSWNGTECRLTFANHTPTNHFNTLSTGSTPNIVFANPCPSGYTDGGMVRPQPGLGIPVGSHICYLNATIPPGVMHTSVSHQ